MAEKETTEDLIQSYRSGSSEAAYILLQKYAPYLRKWRTLLTSGRYRATDGEIIQFLRMLGHTNLTNAAYFIYRRLRYYETEDIEQEICVAFLDNCLKYNNPTTTFVYVLKERVAKLISDPIMQHRVCGDLIDSTGEICANNAPEIDERWVRGITCSERFAELSYRQRKLVQLMYSVGLTAEEASERLGISPATVFRDLAGVKAALEKRSL